MGGQKQSDDYDFPCGLQFQLKVEFYISNVSWSFFSLEIVFLRTAVKRRNISCILLGSLFRIFWLQIIDRKKSRKNRIDKTHEKLFNLFIANNFFFY